MEHIGDSISIHMAENDNELFDVDGYDENIVLPMNFMDVSRTIKEGCHVPFNNTKMKHYKTEI